MGNAAFFSGTAPLFDWGSIPGVFETIYEKWAVTSDPRYIDLMKKAWRQYDIAWLTDWTSVANNGIWVAKGKGKVDTVDKFRGLKIRTSGVSQTKTIEALGGSAVTIAAAELEASLQRGTVDVITTSLTYGWVHGFTDLTDSVAIWPFIVPGFSFPFVANAKAFDALPADLQKALVDATVEVGREQYLAMQSQLNYVIRAIEMSKSELVRPSAAEVAKGQGLVKGVRDEWLKIAGPNGPALLAIVDDVVAKYRAYTGK
jgi:TRAP-type C4-dicarboxylate transport system substrate-binding protein